MGKIYAIISIVAVLALLSCLGGEQKPGENNTQNQTIPGTVVSFVEISIQNNAFSQTSVSLSVGGSIKWSNLDARIHQVQIIDVTSSPVLTSGESWTYVFNEAGTFRFRDADLPFVKGTVTVS